MKTGLNVKKYFDFCFNTNVGYNRLRCSHLAQAEMQKQLQLHFLYTIHTDSLFLSSLNKNFTRERNLSHCSTLCWCTSHQIKFGTHISLERIFKHQKMSAPLPFGWTCWRSYRLPPPLVWGGQGWLARKDEVIVGDHISHSRMMVRTHFFQL